MKTKYLFLILLIILLGCENDGFVTNKNIDGNIYTGNLKHGKFDGRGTLNEGNGDVYVGDFRDGLFDGNGELHFKNGESYSGEFRNGKYDGKGIFKYCDGSLYSGYWKDGKCDGLGEFRSSGSKYYKGEWKAGVKNGNGEMQINENGKVSMVKGIWLNDSLIEELERKSKSLTELYKEIKSSVFLIYTRKNEGTAQGSGFFIDAKGIAVSSYHIFKDASDAIVITDDGMRYVISEIIRKDEENDYIVFAVNNEYKKTFNYVNIAKKLPEIGETCFAVGNPEGLVQTLSTGNISGYREGNKLIQTTAEITHGSSGGPLFNSFGEVVGITTSGLDQANLNFAVNIQNVEIEKTINDKDIAQSQANENRNNASEVSVTKVQKDDLFNKIYSYHSTFKNENSAGLKDFFSADIKRLYNIYNVKPSDVSNEAVKYLKRWQVVNFEMNKDNFQFNEDSFGQYVTEYKLKWVVKKRTTGEIRTFDLDVFVVFDQNLKINSIYENILKKKS
jgi:serine protease Do